MINLRNECVSKLGTVSDLQLKLQNCQQQNVELKRQTDTSFEIIQRIQNGQNNPENMEWLKLKLQAAV